MELDATVMGDQKSRGYNGGGVQGRSPPPPRVHPQPPHPSLEVFEIPRKDARKFWQPDRVPKRNRYRYECSMGFPADRAGGARKKFWLGLPRSTLQYESHLLSMNAEHPQIS